MPATVAAIDDLSIQQFRSSLRGDVLEPGDEDYDAARRLYNGMIDKHPALIVRCAGAADVVSAVRFAREQGLPLSVRGGGHSVAGTALCDDGLVIDMTRMKGIRVDPAARTARAEGGVTWRELDHETQLFGLATTGGTVSSTGIAGLTLGGGTGWLARKHGLAADNLLSVDLVTADGSVLTVSAEQHANLFWAVRGAGANFGVVTSFEYRLHPVGPTVFGGLVAYPFEQAASVLRIHWEFMQSAPDEVMSLAVLMAAPDGTPICAVLMAYTGPIEQGENALRPLRAAGAPVMDQLGPLPYTQLQRMLDEGFPFGLQNYWKSSFMRELSDAAIDTVVDAFTHVPSPLSAVLFEPWGGAANRVPVDATAFSHRTFPYDLLILSRWQDPSESATHIAWTRALWQAIQPWASDQVYVNHLSADESSRSRGAYGANYERLAALKAKYDPTNCFRGNQNIAPGRTVTTSSP